MRAFTVKDAKRIARQFKGSHRARIWRIVPAARSALLDAEVMDQIRAADAVDAQGPVTPQAILNLRTMIEVELAHVGFSEDGF